MSIQYFSGEEQTNQIVSRRERLDPDKKVGIEKMELYHATHIEDILTTAESTNPDCIIIDSIQTVYSEHTESSA